MPQVPELRPKEISISAAAEDIRPAKPSRRTRGLASTGTPRSAVSQSKPSEEDAFGVDEDTETEALEEVRLAEALSDLRRFEFFSRCFRQVQLSQTKKISPIFRKLRFPVFKAKVTSLLQERDNQYDRH